MTPTSRVAQTSSMPWVNTLSTLLTRVTLGNTVESVWRRMVSVTSSRNRLARSQWPPHSRSSETSAESDTSGRRLGSLVVMLVPVWVPLKSSSTLGKRTPRPRLVRRVSSSVAAQASDSLGLVAVSVRLPNAFCATGGPAKYCEPSKDSKFSKRRPLVNVSSGVIFQASWA